MAFLASVNPDMRSGNQQKWGIFAWQRGYLFQVEMEGQPITDLPGESFHYPYYGSFSLNASDLVSFISPRQNGKAGGDLYIWPGGEPIRVASTGTAVHGPGGSALSSTGVTSLALNDLGSIAFNLGLCCGEFPYGLFLSALQQAPVPNDGFETRAKSGLPLGWETSWSSGSGGSASQYDSGGLNAYEGNSVLRLHVNPGGGSTFVLSNSIPVSPDALCMVSAFMRHYLPANGGGAYLSVIQFNVAGEQVGFNERTSGPGDSRWTWEPVRLGVRTSTDTSFIRIRIGLVSSAEEYLHVDAVR